MTIKRSVSIAGHRTSISLEDAFWAHLKRMADDKGQTLPMLVADIDRDRGTLNLSAALRLAVLSNLEQQISAQAGEPA